MRPAKAARGGLAVLDKGPIIILCRTQMGENIGAAARAMLNCGLTRLRLAAPQCGWPNAKAVAAASGAVAVLNGIEIFPDARAATADLHHVFATTARARDLHKPILGAEEAAAALRARMAEDREVGLMFGSERTGLENEELMLADAIVGIAVNPGFASLNLAQAVLLCGYAWWRSGAAVRPTPPPDPDRLPATKAEVAGLIGQLTAELDAVDFFRTPERRASLIDAIAVLLERRQLTQPEVHLLRGIIKDLTGGRRARIGTKVKDLR